MKHVRTVVDRSAAKEKKPLINALVQAAAAPYYRAGRFAWYFAMGKLSADPAFSAILEHGLLNGRPRILDIGCGQGLLASWLLAARAVEQRTRETGAPAWPVSWPGMPVPQMIAGFDSNDSEIARARAALPSPASGIALHFEAADMREASLGEWDAIVLLDVLHYIEPAAQDDLLLRVREALGDSGVLILRVGDAAGSWRFRYSMLVDRLVRRLRGQGDTVLHCRSRIEWTRALKALGFRVKRIPTAEAEQFSNVLLMATVGDNTSLDRN